MFNKFLLGLVAIVGALIVGASTVSAQETCTTVYGGGVVCGAHTPVETGLADFHPAIWGFGFLAASGAALFLAKRVRKA